MIIGSLSENKELEKRISITPEIAKKYISNGFEVLIEKGLGEHLGIKDNDFLKENCKIEDKKTVLYKSDIILQLNLPDDETLDLFNDNKVLIGNFNSNIDPCGPNIKPFFVLVSKGNELVEYSLPSTSPTNGNTRKSFSAMT